jgi:hypothetical protein
VDTAGELTSLTPAIAPAANWYWKGRGFSVAILLALRDALCREKRGSDDQIWWETFPEFRDIFSRDRKGVGSKLEVGQLATGAPAISQGVTTSIAAWIIRAVASWPEGLPLAGGSGKIACR